MEAQVEEQNSLKTTSKQGTNRRKIQIKDHGVFFS